MTVGELLERMSTAELLTWARLDDIDKRLADQQSIRQFMERFGGSSRGPIRKRPSADRGPQ